MSRILIFPVAFFIASLTALAHADDYTDYDRRVARTLFNTLKAGAVATKDKADPGKLDQPLRKDGNKSAASINLPGKDGGSMFSGFFRISINTTMSATTGWKELGNDKETGAQVISRAVDETTDEKYKQYAARKKIGNVILTFIMRRPFDENENAAFADMIKHYKNFYANAVENKLFAGVRLTILRGDATPDDIEAGGEPLPFALPQTKEAAQAGVKVDYVAHVIDAEGNALQDVKKMRIRIIGKLAPYATVDCKRAKYNEADKVWEIENPKPEGEKFTLVLKSDDPKFLKTLYDLPATAAADEEKGIPAIAVKVGVSFK